VSGLHLRFFGAPCLEHGGGEPVSIARWKGMALLAYLAVTGLCHPRPGLAALLWPESPPEAAHSALRNALWILSFGRPRFAHR